MLCASLDNFKRLSDGKDDNTWAQTPESLTQAVGDSFSVVVTHFHLPDKFVVQKVENAGKKYFYCNKLLDPQHYYYWQYSYWVYFVCFVFF